MTLNDVLKTAEVKKNGNGKTKIPIIDVPDKVAITASRIKELKAEMDSLKAEYGIVEEEFLAEVGKNKEMFMKDFGWVPSVKIRDYQGGYVTVVWSHAYSKIPTDYEETLKENVPNYDNYFKEKTTIKVKDVTENTLTELINLVGAENFARFFEVERWIEPTEKFTEDSWKMKEAMSNLTGIIMQKKPSVRVR